MMQKSEAYINKIIEGTGLSRKDLQEMVEKKKEELKGLISEDGALFIIANELGVDVKDENKKLLEDIDLNVSDIKPDMKNITIFGRIKEIYDVFSFKREDDEDGYVGSFLLNDNTGDIRIVLWNDLVSIFEDENFRRNELVKIINGYAKKGRFEETELHISRLGKLVLSPEDADYTKYPKIKHQPININEISLNSKSVFIEGKILGKMPIKEFTKKTGDMGKVGSITLRDTSGTIRITFWNDDTSKIVDFDSGDYIQIANLIPRQSSLDRNKIDLHATRSTKLKKLDKTIEYEEKLLENIMKIQEEEGIVSFQGIIKSVDDLRDVSLKTGEIVSVLSFVVSDSTDYVRVTAWREKGEELSKLLNIDKGILLKNVLIRFNSYSQRKEVTIINDSDTEFIELKIADAKMYEAPTRRNQQMTRDFTKIGTIDSEGVYEIKGIIVKEINRITFYDACPNCNRKVDNCTCEQSTDSTIRMILNVIIDDQSGTIRTTLFGEDAEKLLGQETGVLNEIKETPDFDKFLRDKSDELIGKEFILKGRAKFNDMSSSYDFAVFSFQEASITQELDELMNDLEI